MGFWVIVPSRRVIRECGEGGQKTQPHYLVYLTQKELEFVLATTAATPKGVSGPKEEALLKMYTKTCKYMRFCKTIKCSTDERPFKK